MQTNSLSHRLAEIDFNQRYLSGERKFINHKLDRMNFSNKTFTEVDLRQANIDSSNLEQTSLSGSDLSGSSLVGTSFKKSIIDNVVFNRANLTKAKLSQSKITNVSFFGACLYKASFCEAKLDNLDFSFANLSAAYLDRTDLSTSMFESAIYSSNTAFPDGFDPVEAGMIHESEMLDLESIMAKFDLLYEKAQRCLGDKITAEHLNSSRPEQDWLDEVKTNNKNKIIFKGNKLESFQNAEAEYLRQWMIGFANSCFQIAKDVTEDRELLSEYVLEQTNLE